MNQVGEKTREPVCSTVLQDHVSFNSSLKNNIRTSSTAVRRLSALVVLENGERALSEWLPVEILDSEVTAVEGRGPGEVGSETWTIGRLRTLVASEARSAGVEELMSTSRPGTSESLLCSLVILDSVMVESS